MSDLPAAAVEADEDAMVRAMCLTWRHDFGLLHEDDRKFLRGQMSQLYDHHIAPIIAERDRLAALPRPSEAAPGDNTVYLDFSPAEDGAGNALISPKEPDGPLPYFTLIGCGDIDQQNALAERFVRGFNALGPSEAAALRPVRKDVSDILEKLAEAKGLEAKFWHQHRETIKRWLDEAATTIAALAEEARTARETAIQETIAGIEPWLQMRAARDSANSQLLIAQAECDEARRMLAEEGPALAHLAEVEVERDALAAQLDEARRELAEANKFIEDGASKMEALADLQDAAKASVQAYIANLMAQRDEARLMLVRMGCVSSSWGEDVIADLVRRVKMEKEMTNE
jgi:hypothetical protein